MSYSEVFARLLSNIAVSFLTTLRLVNDHLDVMSEVTTKEMVSSAESGCRASGHERNGPA